MYEHFYVSFIYVKSTSDDQDLSDHGCILLTHDDLIGDDVNDGKVFKMNPAILLHPELAIM